MIQSLKLVHFRNFQKWEFFFSDGNNFIIWENWKWKTNLLEAIALLSWNSITQISFDKLVFENEEFFHIEMLNERSDSLTIFYDKEKNRKKYSINTKTSPYKKFQSTSLKSVIFSPIIMNMMYLSPSLRRDFLDNILKSSFHQYHNILQTYKKALLNRNKVLKNISQKKSQISEIDFWNQQFINAAVTVYDFRKEIISVFSENVPDISNWFLWKINTLSFHYISNLKFNEDIASQIEKYLMKNIQRDIILKSTSIGPHRDDFSILINNKTHLVDFASRWEVKTLILGLKKIEIQFIEKITQRKPILIVDDLLSELDSEHKNFFMKNLHWYQTFISSINLEKEYANTTIVL